MLAGQRKNIYKSIKISFLFSHLSSFMAIGILTIFFTSTLCLFFLWKLTKLIHRVWWSPRHIQRLLSSQGVKGLSYSFPHGNTKIISAMRSQSMGYPMGISHDMFPRIQPHVYLWTKIYGNFL